MTGHQINSLVGDLVAMAQAMERLPEVQAELANARNEIAGLANTVARLEAKLLDKNNEIESGLSRIRKLEEEKDHAETMFLEANDRTQRALDFIKTTFGNAGSLIQALEPPAIAPTPDVQVQAVPAAAGEAGVSAPTGEPPATAHSSFPQIPVPSADTGNAESATSTSQPSTASPAPEVAASPGEPVAYAPTTDGSHSPNASSPIAPSSDAATARSPTASASPDAFRPYAGKTWSEVRQEQGHAPYSKDEWFVGGGTLDNYYA